MKNLTVPLIVLVVVGLIVNLIRVSRESADRARELAALRVSLEQAQETGKQVTVQRDRLQGEVDRLRASSEDIHRLRAEVARLKSEAVRSQEMAEKAPVAVAPVDAGKTIEHPKSRKEGEIHIEDAPPVIQATVWREFGNALTKSAIGRFSDEKGRTKYGFKGQLSDGRAASLVMGDDGTVLEKAVDISADTVPTHIQTPAANFFGDVPISGAREILDGGKVRYELNGKGPTAGMQMTVSGDGTILSSRLNFDPRQNLETASTKP